ncbi:hypothetical protein BH23CHL1_BH23CHL1_19530 [soil metagenome]
MLSGSHYVLHELVGVNAGKRTPARTQRLSHLFRVVVLPWVLSLMLQADHWLVDRRRKDLSAGMDIQRLTSLGGRSDKRSKLAVSLRSENVLWLAAAPS